MGNKQAIQIDEFRKWLDETTYDGFSVINYDEIVRAKFKEVFGT